MNDRLKTLRKVLNLNQKSFGDKLGLSNTAISKLEKGENALTEKNIKAIVREFDVSRLWLTDGKGDMFMKNQNNKRLRQLRKLLKLSQDTFGDRIGLKGSSVSYIESGRNALTEQNIRAIVREFNVSRLWLTEGEGDMFADEQKSQIDKANVINAFLELTDEEWSLLQSIINKINRNIETGGANNE